MFVKPRKAFMILGFHPQFVSKIKAGTKIHTIRKDKHNRWRTGMKIHLATGVRSKSYHCFKEEKCISIQPISIKHYDEKNIEIVVDGRIIIGGDLIALAKNDGFYWLKDFFNWFDNDFEGKIIHWTDFKY